MRLLVSIMLILLIVGIAASVQSGNSTSNSMMPNGIDKNVTNQTNNSINQTNITNQMNNSNQTNTSVVAISILGSNGINRTAMPTPLKVAFNSEPVSFSGNAAARAGEGSAMETPSQAAFGAYVI